MVSWISLQHSGLQCWEGSRQGPFWRPVGILRITARPAAVAPRVPVLRAAPESCASCHVIRQQERRATKPILVIRTMIGIPTTTFGTEIRIRRVANASGIEGAVPAGQLNFPRREPHLAGHTRVGQMVEPTNLSARSSLGFDSRTALRGGMDGTLSVMAGDEPFFNETKFFLSADPNAWPRPESQDTNSASRNPLDLESGEDASRDPTHLLGDASFDSCALCLTCDEANFISLAHRYGPSYFAYRISEEVLRRSGWRLVGFDVVDLRGLISGLYGCGYSKTTKEQLQAQFANSGNEFGLFQDPVDAQRFAIVRGLEIQAHAPFVVTGLLVPDVQMGIFSSGTTKG